MKRIWQIVNSALPILSAVAGYRMVAEYARPIIVQDWFACPAILIGSFLFTLCSIWFAQCFTLRRPSWSRNPLNWRYDPLQSLYITTWIMLGMSIGGALRLPSVGRNGLLCFSMFTSATLGFFVGERFIYSIYHARIAET